MNFDEEIREFLIESSENLVALDSALVQLEQTPDDLALISSVFRTIHTIKGTCGFFGYDLLGGITHVAESLLDQVREQKRRLTPELISLVLEAVDEIKHLLANIESTGTEGEDRTGPVRARLEAAQRISDHRASAIALVPAVERDPEPAREAHLADATIRVDVALLNRLMNVVGELVLARNQLLQHASTQTPSMQKTLQRLNLVTGELQEGLMRTRMQPIGSVWNKLPRVVRDLAARCGKQIQIHMEGAATELDKTILEAIRDPLTHILRNSCDHGIETPDERIRKGKNPAGTVTLRAWHEGGVVHLEIADDGAGFDPARLKAKALEKGLITPGQADGMSTRDALQLIFTPGFSTAAQVTSVSGRGVGMDVVRTNIEHIGGTVDVANRAEGGAALHIQIPLTLAIIPGLVVTLGDAPFILPQASLLELVRLESDAERGRIETVHSTPVFRHRGKLLPLVYLGQVLGATGFRAARDIVNIVLLQVDQRQVGLVVDRILDTQEIVVKPLGRQLRLLPCYVGATIMGDGQPALILDVAGIARLAGVGLHGKAIAAEDQPGNPVEAAPTQMLLLFRAGQHHRLALPLALVDRLEEILNSRIERAAGQHVLRYGQEILPLIDLGAALSPAGSPPPPRTALGEGLSQLIVCSSSGRRIGLLVDRVLDIVSETVTARRDARTASLTPGLLGSAIIGQRITDLIDLEALQALQSPYLNSPCLQKDAA